MDKDSQKIVIIDYGMGNIRSVQRKFKELGSQVQIVNKAEDVLSADKLILPGVGHFANGVKNLKSNGLWQAIDEKVKNHKTPVLGICLGMQLMAKFSEEGNVEGFGWINADVVRFTIKDKLKYKVPHIGWNCSEPKGKSEFTRGLKPESLYYFVHSYHLKCHNDDEILGLTHYEETFPSMAGKEHIIGVQFHPEKSHDSANTLITNFIHFNCV